MFQARDFWMCMHPYAYVPVPVCLPVPVSLYTENIKAYPLLEGEISSNKRPAAS